MPFGTFVSLKGISLKVFIISPILFKFPFFNYRKSKLIFVNTPNQRVCRGRANGLARRLFTPKLAHRRNGRCPNQWPYRQPRARSKPRNTFASGRQHNGPWHFLYEIPRRTRRTTLCLPSARHDVSWHSFGWTNISDPFLIFLRTFGSGLWIKVYLYGI